MFIGLLSMVIVNTYCTESFHLNQPPVLMLMILMPIKELYLHTLTVYHRKKYQGPAVSRTLGLQVEV